MSKELNFLAPPPPIFPPVGIDSTDSSMGFQIPNSLAEQSNKGVVENETSFNSSGSKNGHSKLCSRGHWRSTEDAKLKELVAQQGPQNWNLIAEHLEGRSGKSCRLRWFNQLDPKINRRAFTDDEEEGLLAAHKLYGNKWAIIARIFPGRTDNASYASSSSSVQTNAWSDESTISSNIDESASTCTDLSLTPSSAKFFTSFGQAHQKADSSSTKGNGDFDKFHVPRPMGVANGVDQFAISSDSEVSAAESVGTNKTNNHSMSRESVNGIKNMEFIDFLGVGQT
ncbi:WUSCHEL-related homeobox 11-like [Hibiscus syriacus]|uniref:WUSCHEL-related homeobox 11-like n=1 Tax=Hibiscus syriacus TaxID=106335 RepID=A0A6A2Y3C6_HIBSY|nr:WUSCHEL-related homeobox 11-like [Hibiscus syriacus]